jgi:pimeloyl-ACP methyl ester carboxylesterase
MQDMAEACWEAVDDLAAGEATVLAGCSVGSALIPYMYHLRPDSSAAVILTGTGYNPDYPSVAARRTESYRNEGLDFRWRYTFEDFSPAFRMQPMAHYFAELFTERNNSCDVDSIIYQFEALAESDPDAVLGIGCPLLILSGTEDAAHPRAMELKARMPEAELQVLPGAGHACQMEQPWLFDRFVLDFLKRHDLFPGYES